MKESLLFAIAFSFMHFAMKYLILKSPNKVLDLSDFLSLIFENLGYCTSVMT